MTQPITATALKRKSEMTKLEDFKAAYEAATAVYEVAAAAYDVAAAAYDTAHYDAELEKAQENKQDD